MSANMRAVLIKNGQGTADDLYIGEEPVPEPKAGEVQVKIKNFGLNRMDLMQRRGGYSLPPQASKTIMGVEFSGTVSKLGEGVQTFKEGDEVFGLAFGGAYAEYIVLSAKMLLHKPQELGWVEASGILENWLTAYQAVFTEGQFKPGGNVLVHGGASGVGLAAIQLALHVGGAARVFTTCGTDDKVKFLHDLGGEKLHAFNYRTQNFEEEIKKMSDGVDLVVDFVGKNYFEKNLNLMKLDATLIYLSFLSGSIVEKANLAPIVMKRLTLRGSTLRSRTPEYQHKLLGDFEKTALPLILKGEMEVKVHEVFPWTKAADAHKEMEANKNSGKIVFEVTD